MYTVQKNPAAVRLWAARGFRESADELVQLLDYALGGDRGE